MERGLIYMSSCTVEDLCLGSHGPLPFSHEGRRFATSRIRTHSGEKPADYKQSALPLRPPGAARSPRCLTCYPLWFRAEQARFIFSVTSIASAADHRVHFGSGPALLLLMLLWWWSMMFSRCAGSSEVILVFCQKVFCH